MLARGRRSVEALETFPLCGRLAVCVSVERQAQQNEGEQAEPVAPGGEPGADARQGREVSHEGQTRHAAHLAGDREHRPERVQEPNPCTIDRTVTSGTAWCARTIGS